MKQKKALSEAEILAGMLIEMLAPSCERIEVAGSIRRRKPEVGDIELVAIPKFGKDLLGMALPYHELDLITWEAFGHAVKSGSKYKQIALNEGTNLDLFIVTPPAQWGVIFLLRTGPEDFSHSLVTSKRQGGLLPSCFKIKDGAIWEGDKILPTPEEQDVFKLLGIRYLDPWKRS